MPLNSSQVDIIFNWLPSELCGQPIKKLKSGEVGPENDPPYIIFSKVVDGGIVEYHNAMLELEKTADNYYDDHWGHIEKATIYCVIVSYSQRELADLESEFCEKLYKYEYNLNWPQNKIRFKGIVSPKGLQFQTQEKRGKKLYRALVDFDIEFQKTWIPDEDYIRHFTYNVRDPITGEVKITGSRRVEIRTKTWTMDALIRAQKETIFRMLVTLKKENSLTYQMDVRIV